MIVGWGPEPVPDTAPGTEPTIKPAEFPRTAPRAATPSVLSGAMDGEQWLASYRERLAGIERRAERARDALAEVEGTASSRDGAVLVTVDQAGVLRRLVLTERADALDRAQLAAAVLAAAAAAREVAARHAADALEPLLADGGELARRLGDLLSQPGGAR